MAVAAVKKILLIKTSSLGDLIHTMPAVHDMQQQYPDAELHWLVEEGFADVPLWHPFVQKVHCCAIRRWRKSIFSGQTRSEIKQLKQQLQAEHYDLVIDAQGLLKTAFMARWFNVSAGYDKRSIKEPIASRFYQQKIAVEFTQPAIVRVRQLFATLLDYTVDIKTVKFGLQVQRPDTLTSDLERLLEQPYLVFLHGTNWNSKLWPESYWYDLAQQLAKQGRQVLIPWGDELEKLRAERIADQVGSDLIQVLPKCSLSQLAYLLQNAQAVIGMDTGLSHISAALATPIIGLYGSTNSVLTGLQGEQVISLQSSKSCSPCMKRECPLITEGELIPCYASIGVAEVIQQLDSILAETI